MCPENMTKIYKTSNQNNIVTRNSSLKFFQLLRTKTLAQKSLLYLGQLTWNGLHRKSEHPNSTKKSIAYSQVLRFNKICHNRSDPHNNCKGLLKTLTERVYNKTDTTTQINRAITISRNELLNKIKTSNTERLPLTVTYNRTLLDLNKIIDKN